MHHVIFHKLLQTEGLSVGIGKDVMTEVVAPGQIPMFIEYDAEGTIAGFIVAEPFGSVVVNNGFGNILRLSKDIMPSHPCCAVVARNEIVEQHPEAVQELVNSLVRSGLDAKAQMEETIKIATAFLSQQEEVVRTVLCDPNERVTMDKLMPSLAELEDIQNYLIDTVSVPAISGKIDMEAFVDLRFAEKAGAK